MKTREQLIEICKAFSQQYQSSFMAAGNNLTAGIGAEHAMDELSIMVYLQNGRLKDTLPKTFQDVNVIVKIIGAIRPTN